MKTIKFSEEYEKMPCYSDEPPKDALLLEVLKVNSKDLNKKFIEYDTIYFNKKENNWNYYELPKGEVLILLLKSESISVGGDLWTTIRRFTPQKYKYYKEARGEVFSIEVIKKWKMIINPKDYKKKVKVELTKQEVGFIIDELGRVENNIFVFFGYDKIISKLKKAMEKWYYQKYIIV